MNFLQWGVLFFALGLDTLMLASVLGMSGARGRLRLALVFAAAEALMPALGFLLGHAVTGWLGAYGPWIGATAVLGVGGYLLFEDDDEEEERVEKLLGSGSRLAVPALFVAALMISMDELTVGVSFGLNGMTDVSMGRLLLLLAVQAFLFTWLGLRFGHVIRRQLGEAAEKAAEKAAGLVLIGLGLYLLWGLF